ncbi:hypothetical protein ACU5EH_23820 [Aliivibrio salmonicida]|uniref:hypothetical protein n=1 Tax=Aliivibrio salmonicida TaxID=40269 RepID=UPI00406C2E80
MKVDDILRIQKLASRIRTVSVISLEGEVCELGEEGVRDLLEIQQEQAMEIERIAARILKSVTVR